MEKIKLNKRQWILIYFFILFISFAMGSIFNKPPVIEYDYINLTINYTCPNGSMIEINTNDILICGSVNELHYPIEELEFNVSIFSS